MCLQKKQVTHPIHTAHWGQCGRYYGYPACCIQDFIRRNQCNNQMPRMEPTRCQSLAGKQSGFIPCIPCAWKVLSKQCSLEDLISTTRLEPSRFPSRFKILKTNKRPM